MNAEDEIEDDEVEEYEPMPAGLSDGDVLIFDRSEFEQDFNCYAAMVRGGCLFVLCKEDRKWAPAEGRGLEPSRPGGKLRTVQ